MTSSIIHIIVKRYLESRFQHNASGIIVVISLFSHHALFVCLRHLNASVMLMLGIPDKYAMERGGWSSNRVLKAVYQHTFSEERKLVDARIDGFFNDLLKK